jgi:nitroreductase/dihydropteridine reductase
MTPAATARKRYTAKSFDPARKIPPEVVGEIKELLRFAPSSVNAQPWHFVIASTDAAKNRIAKATQGSYAYNEPKVRNASHVVVLCVRRDMDDRYLESLLDREEADGRFRMAHARDGQRKSRSMFVDLHRLEQQDLKPWMEKQVYLALGTLLFGAAQLGLDACPMEGFDRSTLDRELGLTEQGYASLVLLSLGYHGTDDFNAALPKSRLPTEQVISSID